MNLSDEELKLILDDFLQYKDYFENPPEEAYLIDEMDYSKCKEARDLEHLLYKYEIFDKNYYEKLRMMETKYGASYYALSREKLSFEEIIALLTWMHRQERHSGGCFLNAIENKTFYNLICRMEEIRNEL